MSILEHRRSPPRRRARSLQRPRSTRARAPVAATRCRSGQEGAESAPAVAATLAPHWPPRQTAARNGRAEQHGLGSRQRERSGGRRRPPSGATRPEPARDPPATGRGTNRSCGRSGALSQHDRRRPLLAQDPRRFAETPPAAPGQRTPYAGASRPAPRTASCTRKPASLQFGNLRMSILEHRRVLRDDEHRQRATRVLDRLHLSSIAVGKGHCTVKGDCTLDE